MLERVKPYAAKNMTQHFTFDFYFRDYLNEVGKEGPEETYFFDVSGPSDLMDRIHSEELLLDFTMDMEEYGIHDFYAGGPVWYGFGSGEIHPNKYREVVEKWHEELTRQGVTCGEIQVLPAADYQAKFP